MLPNWQHLVTFTKRVKVHLQQVHLPTQNVSISFQFHNFRGQVLSNLWNNKN